jgi:hypothetical protein
MDRSGHTRSIRQLAALLSALGLSLRYIVEIFEDFGIDLSYSTVWREGQELNSRLNKRKITNYLHNFTIDKEYIHNVSSKFGVVVALDLGGDKYTILGTLNECNPSSVLSWLKPLVKESGIKASQLSTGTLDYMHHPPHPITT